jgi:pimeloyl-ACP methyl ester carboxylesterase
MSAVRRTAAIDTGLQFGLRNRWYPIYESADLGHGRAIGIKRLGEELALWLQPFSLDELADRTVSLFDELQVDRAHVLGVSMGGVIAQLVYHLRWAACWPTPSTVRDSC